MRFKRSSSGKPRSWKESALIKFAFLAPAIIYLLIFMIFPTAFNAYCSFQRWYMGGGEPEFIGTLNYVLLFSDKRFYDSILFTFSFVAVVVPLEIALGLILALALTKIRVGRRIIATLMLIPFVIPAIATGYMWKMLFHGTYGPITFLASMLGFKRVHILSTPGLSFWGIVTIDVWRWVPFLFLVFYAALSTLPVEPLEAALVDGASAWQRFRYITLPLMTPTILVMLFLKTVEAFKVLDIIYIATGGGARTESASLYIYRVGLKHFNVGMGAAMAWIFFAIVITLITVMLLRFQKYMMVSG